MGKERRQGRPTCPISWNPALTPSRPFAPLRTVKVDVVRLVRVGGVCTAGAKVPPEERREKRVFHGGEGERGAERRKEDGASGKVA